MRNRLTLIGSRACGKSTAGRLAAARLAWPYIDADQALEERLGGPIAAYFAAHGEAAFRDRESACLAEVLAGHGPLVLATGGGVVLRESNRALLRERGGLVVYLEVPVPILQERLRRNAGGRMSLTGASIADEVPRLLAEREPLYRAAAMATIPAVDGADAVAQRLVELVESPESGVRGLEPG